MCYLCLWCSYDVPVSENIVEDGIVRVVWCGCQMVKCRRATREELQTSHSETYVHMYASSARHRDPAVFGMLLLLLSHCISRRNATLAGIPLYLLKRLQSVMNSAARLVFSSSHYDHVTTYRKCRGH